MKKHVLLLVLTFLASILTSCLGGGNSGSETTNGLSGRINDENGMPANGARVVLLDENYNPHENTNASNNVITTTNASGVYQLSDIPSGHYHLELSDTHHGTQALVQNITIAGDGSNVKADGILTKPGTLQIPIQDYFGKNDTGYLYIPGSTVMLTIDSSTKKLGYANLNAIPVGTFAQLILIIGDGANQKTISVAHNFTIQPSQSTTLLAYQDWKYSRAISINTSAAGVTQTLRNFPMLVRLDSTNFDFSQAQSTGQDLRFANNSGASLPFEIESWDAVRKKATVWVKIDTIKVDSTTANFSMYWGRTSTSTDFSSPKVFDALSGIVGLWHLNEGANQTIGGYKDAGPFGNNLTAEKINLDAQGTGIINTAKVFNGNPDGTGPLAGAIPQGLGGNAAFSISFWMKLEMTQTRAIVFDFGSPGILQDFHFIIGSDTTAQIGGMDINNSSGSTPATWQNTFKLTNYISAWTFVAITYNPQTGILTTYMNGQMLDQKTTPPLKIDTNGGFRIGKVLSSNLTDAPYYGALDEFRFYNFPLTAERINLEYLTQK